MIFVTAVDLEPPSPVTASELCYPSVNVVRVTTSANPMMTKRRKECHEYLSKNVAAELQRRAKDAARLQSETSAISTIWVRRVHRINSATQFSDLAGSHADIKVEARVYSTREALPLEGADQKEADLPSYLLSPNVRSVARE